MVDWIGLLLPVAYLTVLVGSLATFSHLYRRRKAAKSASLEPWFPPHLQRNVYLSLLHLDPADAGSTPAGSEKSLAKVPDSIIKAALLRRAAEDISRVVQIRASKQALQALLHQGIVGEELWQRFQRAEQEIEDECKDVMTEANALSPNWGQHIFQSADQLYNNQILKERLADTQEGLEDERAWWDNRKQGIQKDFMQELDNDDAVAAAAGGKSTSKSAGKKPATPKIGAVKSASDEDAIIVESGGPTGSQGQSGGTARKRKGGKR